MLLSGGGGPVVGVARVFLRGLRGLLVVRGGRGAGRVVLRLGVGGPVSGFYGPSGALGRLGGRRVLLGAGSGL